MSMAQSKDTNKRAHPNPILTGRISFIKPVRNKYLMKQKRKQKAFFFIRR